MHSYVSFSYILYFTPELVKFIWHQKCLKSTHTIKCFHARRKCFSLYITWGKNIRLFLCSAVVSKPESVHRWAAWIYWMNILTETSRRMLERLPRSTVYLMGKCVLYASSCSPHSKQITQLLRQSQYRFL